jgi:hypothetical protein
MATAVATITVNNHPNGLDNTQRRVYYYGVLALSGGGTYVTNGIPLPWSAMVDQSGAKVVAQAGPATTQPQDASFYSALGGIYQYNYDKTHNTLRIISGGTELANAAAITADTINFCAEYLRGI